LCGELKGVVDQVSSHCNTNTVGVLLLGTMVDDDPCIRDCSIRGDVSDFRVGEKKDGVSGLCYTRFALCQAMDLLAHCWHPEVFQVWVIHQLALVRDCLFGHRVHDTITVILYINDRASPL
jgi:hypothetical protein